MLRPGNPNIPSLHELMSSPSFDVWEDSDGLEDSDEEWNIVENKTRRLRPSTMNPPPPSSNKYRRRTFLRNKKKGRSARKIQVQDTEEYKQPPRTPVTLAEFIPKKFFEKGAESAQTRSPHTGGVRTPKAKEEGDTLQCCMVTIKFRTYKNGARAFSHAVEPLDAQNWVETIEKMFIQDQFTALFRVQYISHAHVNRMREEFLNLKKSDDMTVMTFEQRFRELSYYVLDLVKIEQERFISSPRALVVFIQPG
ncbi:hypothetical protein ACLB2K_007100 [Fragaria x ananassa]